MDGTRDRPRRRVIQALDRIGLTVSGLGAIALVAYLVGSLIFTGGQLGATLAPNYEQILPWPLFEVPAWLALVVLGAFVPMAALAGPAEAGRIPRAIRCTAAGIVSASLLWMLAFPSSIGQQRWPEPTATAPGAHWVALVIGLVTIALMLLLGWRDLREHDRARRDRARALE